MQDDTDSVNNDCSIDKFILNDDCVRTYEQQETHHQQQQQSSQQKQNHRIVEHPTMSTKSIFIMFQILYISIVYLLFTTNAVVFANAIDSTEIGGSAGNGNELFRLMALASDPSSAIDFDPTNRGSKKFGDKCESTQECSFAGSICDPKKNKCQCIDDLPITNHLDKCGKEASVNESCFFNEQCENVNYRTECRDGRCSCKYELTAILNKDGNIECKALQESREPERYVDPAMIGILAGMALMFIIICVVLRLFSRARWRENRTIFNTPNPRLMNVSLLRDNKLMHSQERRGSRMSMRMPSRQPSMVSLRPHSPNPSIGRQGSRRGSRNNSNTSAASTRSNRSNSTGHSINKGNHHHDIKSRASALKPITSLTTSIEPITNDINHDDQVITAIIPINISPTSNDKHLGDMTDI